MSMATCPKQEEESAGAPCAGRALSQPARLLSQRPGYRKRLRFRTEESRERSRDYCPIPQETAARSFAAALDPLVEQIGRVSVVRGMETKEFSDKECPDDEYAKFHRWDGDGPWRLVFVLPQGVEPERAADLLWRCPHVCDVQSSHHPSGSFSLALVVDQTDYDRYHGLRPVYRGCVV